MSRMPTSRSSRRYGRRTDHEDRPTTTARTSPIAVLTATLGVVGALAPHPAPGQGSLLITDLGGRPPLLGTASGAYRIAGGDVVRIVAGAISGGVVRADGRGWILPDGRLLALDAERELGPVIDAGDRRGDRATPVAVQLAKGVAPSRLALPDATVGLDPAGRVVVVSGGVALGVDDGGTVAVLGQDARLQAVSAVQGGLAVDDSTRLRVDLPR